MKGRLGPSRKANETVPVLLETMIEIHARPDRVWQCLTDFTQYEEWNPYLPRVGGQLRVGEVLEVTVQPGRGQARVFAREVVEILPGNSFSWRGTLLWSWVFEGRHSFRVISSGEGATRFENVESFSGVLAYFLLPLFGRSIRGRFEAMNQALRRTLES